MVDLGCLGGPGGQENPPKRWGAKRPTFWNGVPGRRGRLDPKKDHVRAVGTNKFAGVGDPWGCRLLDAPRGLVGLPPPDPPGVAAPKPPTEAHQNDTTTVYRGPSNTG